MTRLDPATTDAESYALMRALTSPLVAITTRSGDRTNGMIANSAIRASLVPERPAVANYVFKRHLTHQFLVESGQYVLHVLGRDQWDEIWSLGFRSGREADKLARLELEWTPESRLPVLRRCWSWMECRVINVMDAGASTFFMGKVVRLGRGPASQIMDSDWFREHMPADWKPLYLEQLEEAQRWAAVHGPEADDTPWRTMRADGARSADSTPDLVSDP